MDADGNAGNVAATAFAASIRSELPGSILWCLVLKACSSPFLTVICDRLPVGQPMTTERLRGAVRRIMRRAGLTGGGPHRLRHSFATRLHARGATLKEVADVLGHQDFDTTAIYARVNLSQLRKVALPWPRTRILDCASRKHSVYAGI